MHETRTFFRMNSHAIEEIWLLCEPHVLLGFDTYTLWKKLLKVFGQKYFIRSLGFSVRPLLPNLFDSEREIRAVIIVAGMNSYCRNQQPAQDIRKNIQDILKFIKDRNPSILVILTTPPPPIRDGPKVMDLRREQGRILEIASVIREFEGPNVGICDLHTALSGRESHRRLYGNREEVWEELVMVELGVHGISGL
ncbi:hypothetical protein EJ08DRAFT_665065 [Tothia fuscella]|uniref:SGNH hydrolase-type esterase domain-containing protein n=1 Tax=Tothia fuscella TaxID=1048955 RepID=A0A9P4TU23_9PEZI|nr:hypothetical protein EJ08DRAFT_665065 [Tothia fuscella]